MKGDSFTRKEVSSQYVEEGRDRWIVSLVVGYADEDFGTGSDQLTAEQKAKLAAGAALDLTKDEGSSDTVWFVYDRLDRQMYRFEQDDFDKEVIE
jgi:hypothetical protein